MLLINNEINLGKSFEKLMNNLKEVYGIAKSGKPGCHARALGILESHVKVHLIKCTDADMKQLQDFIEAPVSADNIPDDVFTQAQMDGISNESHKIAYDYGVEVADLAFGRESQFWKDRYFDAYKEKIKELISDGSFS